MMLKEQARRTAVGMCLHLAAGREEEAGMLMRLYVEDGLAAGIPPAKAFSVLAQIGLSLAVAAGSDREDWFEEIAQNLAVQA